MIDELQLIERLASVRRILNTNTALADTILLSMIEEAERKVADFEREHEEELI
jgi:hypothetical protein